MEFVEAPAFTKHLLSYLSDDEYRELQEALTLKPEAGDLIQGTGGFRVIYFFFPEDRQIWLLTIYGKNEADDLTAEQKKALKTAIEAEKKTRAIRRIK